MCNDEDVCVAHSATVRVEQPHHAVELVEQFLNQSSYT